MQAKDIIIYNACEWMVGTIHQWSFVLELKLGVSLTHPSDVNHFILVILYLLYYFNFALLSMQVPSTVCINLKLPLYIQSVKLLFGFPIPTPMSQAWGQAFPYIAAYLS